MSTSSRRSPQASKRSLTAWVKLSIILLTGALGGYFFSYFLQDNLYAPSLYHKLALLPVLLGVVLLVLIVHEGGHVLAGWWVGFEFRMVTVGPFMLQKEGEKIRFRWNTRLNAAGGLAMCLPKTEQNLRRNFIKFVAGGPIASLLFALLCLGIYYLTSRHSQVLTLSNFWLLSGTMSAMIFFTTIIPMRSKGFFSDGARLLNLIKGGNKATIDLVILTATVASSSGIRPRDLNVAPIAQILESERAHPFIPYLQLYMYAHLIDQQKPAEAYPYLLEALAGKHHIPTGYQAMLWLDLAFYQAYYLQKPQEAQETLQKAKINAVTPTHLVHKSKAAIGWAKGANQVALQEAYQALEALSQSTDKGGAIAEEEFLQQFIQTLENAIA
ncbi:site-2 protease family protein [uncultured Microscilla sp.]|uniref:site-2 protease family protein n=1 Tax=uncultured Microscilla sp. TaxID=432653 RepID=UPI0026199B04|nr:site-2 protease family protein [uncultured Microscilla sp.]